MGMPTLSGCLSRRQQDKNGDGLTVLPLTNMQTVASRCWQQTCVAKDMSVKLMKGSSTGSLQDVNPQMAALLSPKWRTRSLRASCSRQSLFAQQPHAMVMSQSCSASGGEGAHVAALP